MSGRERRLWILAAACLLLIYSTLWLVRPIAEFLRQQNLLRLTVAVAFLAAGAVVLAWALRARRGWREMAVLGVSAAVYVVILAALSIPEERIHLFEYGIFALLVYGALDERRRGRSGAAAGPGTLLASPGFGAVTLTLLCGLIDEVIQGLLPNRYYGHRDVLLNGLAGLLVVLAILAVHRARRLDAAAAADRTR